VISASARLLDGAAWLWRSHLQERRTALQKYFWIALGGALGSLARFWVGTAVASRMGIKFPYGTLIVNLTACVIIGFSITYLGRRADLNPAWRYLIPVGFVGAYSTFSTYEWETLSTLRSGAFFLAAVYAVGSLILGLVAVWGGSLLAEVL
jgi:fluoride exporter